MSNPVDVKWFTSDMPGAPALSGTAGTLIAVLDACLINGFGSVTLTSLTVSGGVATAVKVGHGFLDHVVLLIGGSTPVELNGEKRITQIDANTFSFDATGIADQVATGTITAKMAPVGWEKRYSDTNKAAYARTDLAATAMLLRVDDSGATVARVIGYESMSGINTDLVGPFPTTGQLSGGEYWHKSNSASIVARWWRVFADARAFYIYSSLDNSAWNRAGFFGDINSYKSPDAYACGLVGSNGASINYLGVTTTSWLCRASTGASGAIAASRYSHAKSGAQMGVNGQTYPATVDNSFHAWPVEVWEGTTLARGLMPGFWNPLHNSEPADGTVVTDVPQLSGHLLFVQQLNYGSNSRIAMDITGPWR